MYRFFNRPRTNLFLLLIATFFFALAANLVSPTVAYAAGTTTQAPTIVGGEEASQVYPWMAALVKIGTGAQGERQFCGGTLIDPEWVLTAAHCTYRGGEERSADTFNVLIGASHLNSGKGQEIQIAEIIRHPEYNGKTNHMDVALLRLAHPVSYAPIDMGNAASLDAQTRTQLRTLGWGRTESLARSTALLQVNVPLVEAETCQSAYAIYGYSILDSMICAGYAQGGKDACSGDSGGPLVAPIKIDANGNVEQWALVGVVSWGVGCAQQNAYGVYVNVGAVMDWATNQIEQAPNPKVSASAQTVIPTIYLPIVQ